MQNDQPILLATFKDDIEASMLIGLLDEHGIHATLIDNRAGRYGVFTTDLRYDVHVFVAPSDIEEARKLQESTIATDAESKVKPLPAHARIASVIIIVSLLMSLLSGVFELNPWFTITWLAAGFISIFVSAMLKKKS